MRFESEFELFPIGPDGPDPSRRLPLRRLDPDREDDVLRHGFADTVARERVAALTEVQDSWRPDVVVSDEVDFGAMLAAEKAGTPNAVVLVIGSGSFIRSDVVAEPLLSLRTELVLPADPELAMLEGALVLSAFPPSYRDSTSPPSGRIAYFRAFEAEDSQEPGFVQDWPDYKEDRPTVYVTLGTDFNVESGDLFSRILDGIANFDANVVVTVGHQIDPIELGTQPPNVWVERFIPQSALLPICDVMISHGGSGSVLGALSFGKPMVILPMGADQAMNGARCEKLGVGIVLDAFTATSDEIQGAVVALLEARSFRFAAETLRDEIAAMPAPEEMVPLLEQLAGVP